MDYIPYRLENLFTGTGKPAPVKNNSIAYAFWKRALFQRLCSIIEFELPENWERARDYFEACLFCRGFVGVFDTDKFGIAFQEGQISGFDFYYQPTKFIVSNPALSKTFTIHEDCSLIKLTNDFRGCMDTIDYFAEKLATLDGAVNMAIINSKLAYVFAAHNKQSANAVKMIFDKINAGESTIVYDAKITDGLGDTEPFTFLDRASLKNSYITTDLLNDAQTILNQFDAEIGIPTIPAEKRERMITDEANSRKADSTARVTLWDECLKNSIKEVNSMFGLNIKYKFRFLENDIPEEDSEEKGDSNSWEFQLSQWQG